jgi:hypothetical protein
LRGWRHELLDGDLKVRWVFAWLPAKFDAKNPSPVHPDGTAVLENSCRHWIPKTKVDPNLRAY